jgi:hypothetical protein
MDSNIKRLRGGQPNNRNALKHGYYCSALTAIGKNAFIDAKQVDGLDDEIALLRASLKAVVLQSPTNVRLISEASASLVRLLRAREKLGFARPPRLEEPGLEDLDDIVAHL